MDATVIKLYSVCKENLYFVKIFNKLLTENRNNMYIQTHHPVTV